MRNPALSSSIKSESLERRLLFAIGIDPSFGDAGIAKADTGVNGFHGTVMIRELTDGKILAVTGVGFSEAMGGTNVNAAITRFNANGLPDTTFGGGDGVALITIGDLLGDAVLQPDGKVVLVGQRGHDLTVTRVTTDGELDTTFAGDGVAEITVENAATDRFTAQGAALSPNGTIVASGSLRMGDDDSDVVIARFTPAGLPAATFGGGDGLLVVDRPGFVDYAQVAVDATNRVLVSMREDDRAVIGRYTSTGVADPAFGSAGFATFAQSRPGGDFPFSLTVAPDGAGVVVGAEGFVGWLNSNGTPNTAFGGAGTVSLPSSAGFGAIALEVAVDGAGRVVTVVDTGALRFLGNGTPDPDFGTAGHVLITDMTSSAINVASSDAEVLFVGGGASASNAVVTAARIGEAPGVVLGPTGVLVVTGTAADDSVVLDTSAGEARLNFNGSVTTYPLADVKRFNVSAGAGANSVMLSLDIPATIRAGSGDDAIVTADGDDLIEAGGGDNNVASGAGSDTVNTGAGSDTIATGDGTDTVRAGEGDDSVTTGDGDDFIELGLGNNFAATSAGKDTILALLGDDSIDGGAGDDFIRADDGKNTAAGGAGDDFLETLDGADSLTGGGGNDTLLGGNGDNALFGGTGNDFLKTGTGADTLWGEIGNDTLRAGDGDDYLNGGASKDRLFGQQGSDTLYGGRNNDALDGGPGSDLLKGLDGNDKLFDAEGTRDSLDGGAGIDVGLFDDPLDAVLRIETVL